MSLIDFKGKAQAEAWKRDLQELNDQTDQILKNVYNCIAEIKNESSGDPVEQLVITAADLADAAAEVIKGLRGLEKAIDDIIQILIQKISEATQNVIGGREASTDL